MKLNESTNVRLLDDDLIGISLDETTNIKDVVKLWSIFDLNIKYEKKSSSLAEFIVHVSPHSKKEVNFSAKIEKN